MSRIVWVQARPWTRPRRGADLRTQGLIQGALAQGHDVLVIAPDEPEQTAPSLRAQIVSVRRHGNTAAWAAAKILSRYPLRAPHPPRRVMQGALRSVVAFKPDIVVVSEAMAWRLTRSVSPAGVPVIYDAHNVETVLFRTVKERADSMLDRVTLSVDARRVARTERQILDTAASVMAASEDDAAVFRRLSPGTHVSVVPSSVPTPDTATRPDLSGPEVLFVGALDYHPNIDAVAELVGTLMPRVREAVPAAHLTVVGRGAPEGLRRLLQGADGVTLREDVDDLEPLYRQSRCVAVPIRSGGGTKLKAFEALAYGLPLVCTAETVRGIDLREGEAVVADSPEELTAAIVRLLRDPATAASVGAAAREAFVQRLSWATVRRPLNDALESALAVRRV